MSMTEMTYVEVWDCPAHLAKWLCHIVYYCTSDLNEQSPSWFKIDCVLGRYYFCPCTKIRKWSSSTSVKVHQNTGVMFFMLFAVIFPHLFHFARDLATSTFGCLLDLAIKHSLFLLSTSLLSSWRNFVVRVVIKLIFDFWICCIFCEKRGWKFSLYCITLAWVPCLQSCANRFTWYPDFGLLFWCLYCTANINLNTSPCNIIVN